MGFELPAGEWVIDTQKLAREFCPGQPASLEDQVARFGLRNNAAHTALADADVTAQVFKHFAHEHGLTFSEKAPMSFAESPCHLIRDLLPGYRRYATVHARTTSIAWHNVGTSALHPPIGISTPNPKSRPIHHLITQQPKSGDGLAASNRVRIGAQ